MGKHWAICIGINRYYNLQPLQYAVQDAEAMRDFLLNEGQFEQVYYFSDHSPAIATPRGPMRSLPTFANLKRFFRERFQPSLNAGDTVWFFFAGHGELYEGHDYLMPLDVDPGNVAETALRLGDITADLRNSGATHAVLVLDACRSQSRRSGIGFGSDAQAGMVTIYACSPKESSYEIEALNHGAFTHVLLEGLRLKGVDNCATVERLDQYLRRRVPALNAQYGKPAQVPYTAVEPITKQHWVLFPQVTTLATDVQTLRLDAFQAEAEQDYGWAEQIWTCLLGLSPGDPQAIEAIKRLTLVNRPPATVPHSPVPSPSAPPPHPATGSPAPTPSQGLDIPVVALESDRQVDYTGLRDLLAAHQWQAANQETEQVMLKTARRTREGWLSSRSISQFPLVDLKTIDQLWSAYSQGHFGFTVQRQIFERVQHQEDRFLEQVAWEQAALFGGVPFSSSAAAQLQFTLTAPQGHLPFVFGGEHGWIFERLEKT
jgi:uncharacterized caspase-like protein